MNKSRLNLTIDTDLIEFVKIVAMENRTSVSDIFTQLVLNLKRAKEDDPMEIIISDPAFKHSLLKTISNIRAGKGKWYGYKEVFG